jgi:hypothetical protein
MSELEINQQNPSQPRDFKNEMYKQEIAFENII